MRSRSPLNRRARSSTPTGLATFPALQKLQQDLRHEQENPTSAPPSQGPFGEQAPLPTPVEHPNPPVDAPGPWLITPTIQVSETATDNAGFTHDNRQADLETFINPSLSVTGDTNRVKVDINYSPIYQRNAVVSANDRLDQNFFGTGTFSVVPDALFLNTRASASEGSRSGSFGPINPTDLRLTDRTQVLAYDAGPEWRFPLIADSTGDLRYSIGQTRFYDNTGAFVTPTNGQPVVNNSISDGTLQDLRLFLDSGDRGKLLSGQFTTEGTRDRISDGGGTNDTGTIMIENQLRLSPVFQLVGSVGYEDLRYSNLPLRQCQRSDQVSRCALAERERRPYPADLRAQAGRQFVPGRYAVSDHAADRRLCQLRRKHHDTAAADSQQSQFVAAVDNQRRHQSEYWIARSAASQ